MKKLSKLGEELTQKQQKEIKGGRRLVGFSDGECNTGGSCNPYGNGSDCPDLDHYCQGIYPEILPNGTVAYLGGVCTCD